MALELWIVLALVVAGALTAAALRLRSKGKRPASASSGEKNVYPLW